METNRQWLSGLPMAMALALAVAAPAVGAGEEIPFSDAEIFFELNDTDGDIVHDPYHKPVGHDCVG